MAVLFGGVWWVWNYSAWAMNWLDPNSGLVRILNGLLMIAALGMSLGLPHAFAEDGLLFAACYVAAQVGRAAFMAVAMRGARVGQELHETAGLKCHGGGAVPRRGIPRTRPTTDRLDRRPLRGCRGAPVPVPLPRPGLGADEHLAH